MDEFKKAAEYARRIRYVKDKCVFDDKEGNIFMMGIYNDVQWLYRWKIDTGLFVSVKEVENTGLIFTSGTQIHKIDEV